MGWKNSKISLFLLTQVPSILHCIIKGTMLFTRQHSFWPRGCREAQTRAVCILVWQLGLPNPTKLSVLTSNVLSLTATSEHPAQAWHMTKKCRSRMKTRNAQSHRHADTCPLSPIPIPDPNQMDRDRIWYSVLSWTISPMTTQLKCFRFKARINRHKNWMPYIHAIITNETHAVIHLQGVYKSSITNLWEISKIYFF